MKIWRISQDQYEGYDTFDSAIVAAETEEAAKSTHPSEYGNWDKSNGDWCSSPGHVTAEYIGDAAPHIQAGVILASFNAG